MHPARTRRGGHVRIRWAKWSPFVLLPFSVLFIEAFLHTQILFNGYEINDLNKEIKVLTRSFEALRAEEANLETMDRIKAKAPELGLVKPEPGQIRVIRARAGPGRVGSELSYDMASLDPSADTDSKDVPEAPNTNIR